MDLFLNQKFYSILDTDLFALFEIKKYKHQQFLRGFCKSRHVISGSSNMFKRITKFEVLMAISSKQILTQGQ